jgi:hypothetical protein
VLPTPPASGPQPTTIQEVTVDTTKDTAQPAHPSTPEDHPHACNDGWVTVGQLIVDEDTGEEMEEFALYLCRRCRPVQSA